MDALLWTTQIELDGLKKKTLLGRLGSGDASRRSRERGKSSKHTVWNPQRKFLKWEKKRKEGAGRLLSEFLQPSLLEGRACDRGRSLALKIPACLPVDELLASNTLGCPQGKQGIDQGTQAYPTPHPIYLSPLGPRPVCWYCLIILDTGSGWGHCQQLLEMISAQGPSLD